MTDLIKRTSLKILGAASAGIGMGMSLAPSFASEQAEEIVPHSCRIQINLVHTSAVAEDTLILINRGETDITVQEFVPGVVVFQDLIVDLNAALANRPVVITAKGAYAARIAIQPSGSQPIREYIWAEQVVSSLSAETQVVELEGLVSQGQVLVFTDDKGSTALA